MLAQIQLALPIAAVILAVVAIWQNYALRKRLSQVLGGSDAAALEQALKSYYQRVKHVDAKLEDLTEQYKQLTQMASLASQKISVVRFNPFGDTGGDQSFTLAVLDSHNSGYVLTSIHGREGTRVYVKPIDFGSSKYTLSTEEQQAIDQAIKRVPRKEANVG